MYSSHTAIFTALLPFPTAEQSASWRKSPMVGFQFFLPTTSDTRRKIANRAARLKRVRSKRTLNLANDAYFRFWSMLSTRNKSFRRHQHRESHIDELLVLEDAFDQDRFSIDLVKKHSYFRMEQFEQLYSLVEMLKDEQFTSLVFHWLPAAEFLKTFAKVISRIVPNTFSRNGVQTKTTEVIVAKLAGYLNASSYSDYLKSQIVYAKQRIEEGDEHTLSTMLNNDLKLVTNTFGYTMPKLLGLLEDVVRLHAARRNIRGKIDYDHLRMIFENLHLPPGVNALEEIGIPVQTLHRIASMMEFPQEVGVDGLADYLRANVEAWKDIGYVDQTFVKRALGIAQDFA